VNGQDQEFGTARLTDFVARHDCNIFQLMEDIVDFSGNSGLKDDTTVVLLQST